MSRLVTFGCSLTFGHGLPDIHKKENDSGPSAYAWPELLAKKLNRTCVNMGSIGSGNYEIMLKLMKYNFYPDDLVIVAYSYFVRYDYFDIQDKLGNGLQLKMNSLQYKNLLIDKGNLKNYDNRNYFDNWLAIQNCSLFLNQNKIQNFCYLIFAKELIEEKPSFLNIPNYLNDLSFKDIDSALDKVHPGLESHKLQAERVYNKIIQHELR